MYVWRIRGKMRHTKVFPVCCLLTEYFYSPFNCDVFPFSWKTATRGHRDFVNDQLIRRSIQSIGSGGAYKYRHVFPCTTHRLVSAHGAAIQHCLPFDGINGADAKIMGSRVSVAGGKSRLFYCHSMCLFCVDLCCSEIRPPNYKLIFGALQCFHNV